MDKKKEIKMNWLISILIAMLLVVPMWLLMMNAGIKHVPQPTILFLVFATESVLFLLVCLIAKKPLFARTNGLTCSLIVAGTIAFLANVFILDLLLRPQTRDMLFLC